MKIFIEFLAVFCIICAAISMAMGGDNPADPLDQYATDPLNAMYLIEGQAVRLTAGYCELPAAPGSAMKSRTAVWGQPIYGDMDDDGDRDAAVLLTHDPGGSATFYSEDFVFDSQIGFRQKITFDLTRLDDDGLYGAVDAKRALAYEFCIPNTEQSRKEVKAIDPTVKFFAQSPGRIGCGESENLCIGSTHQKDFRGVLQRLAALTYVQRIDESFFE
jgi:hypothetical protein